ncbi:MAG TPA: hypothetical protein VE643_09140 [Nitrososphaeraceae archaeon]|nr:hypothetical protein [Nitrososphaeraceae archaeon]
MQSSGGVEAVGNTDDNNIIISTISTTVAQSGQALWPFESQIPGSNPGRSKILFYFYLTATHSSNFGATINYHLVGWLVEH